MSISRDEVLHVAKLAELQVTDAEAKALAGQLDGIVRFVDQLSSAEVPEGTPEFTVGPARVALREDRVAPEPLDRSPERMAPDWQDGFYVVPRLAHQEGES